MRRRVLSILYGASLAACALTMLLWGRSFWIQDQVERETRDPASQRILSWCVWSGDGSIGLAVFTLHYTVRAQYNQDDAWKPPQRLRLTRTPVLFSRPISPTVCERLGFSFRRFRQWDQYGFGPYTVLHTDTSVTVPHWLIALGLLVVPARGVARRLGKGMRGRPGRCRGCGYDLRATQDRCPECGEATGARAHGHPTG